MKRGQVRIIGGQWRGRRLPVPDVAGLRPTPDRVRETLFNWLGAGLINARCLDAFAGTGALGFEAASRGASEVVMTEHSPVAARNLKEQRTLFDANTIDIICGSQPAVLQAISGMFDVVFLDPPWQQSDLLWKTFAALIEQGKLAPDAWVYLETPTLPDATQLPVGWRVFKQTRAGDVHSTLVERIRT